MEQKTNQTVYTNKARCRDCYRCIKVCPVKAIKMHHGQAFVIEERCISCGTCIKECPQDAKTFRSDLQKAVGIVGNRESEGPVIATLAPSYAAVFPGWEALRLPSALRQLGFDKVMETASGALITAEETAKFIRSREKARPHICTACPSVVSLVEKYHPSLAKNLIPAVSPMIAHGRYLKDKFGTDTKVIFIGPCVAKKTEAQRPEFAGSVDCVLTFSELHEWMERENINLSQCEETGFDGTPGGKGRFFPINGGIIKTAGLSEEEDLPILTVSGAEEVLEALELLEKRQKPVIVDPLFCLQGCINGPAACSSKNIFERKEDLVEFAVEPDAIPSFYNIPESGGAVDYTTSFSAAPGEINRSVDEHEIREVLERTGKALPEEQLNCGACGYDSCREKAIAVIRGLAEEEMCIPAMRRRAEQKSDQIIEYSPSGIVILNEKLQIMNMNRTFKKFFMVNDSVLGRPISYLLDPELYERLASGREDYVEGTASYSQYSLTCHYLLYAIRDIGQYIGTYVNITSSSAAIEKLTVMKRETIQQAQALLAHELETSQQFAKLLGESAGKTERLVQQIIEMAATETIAGGDDAAQEHTSYRNQAGPPR